VLKGCVVLTDGGKKIQGGQEDVFEKLGAAKHLVYPACVHQFLSPNDNDVHGAAKGKWRNYVRDFSDDVEACLTLLGHIDGECERGGQLFERNLQFRADSSDCASRQAVHELIGSSEVDRSEFFKTCAYAYFIYAGMDARGGTPDVPKGLDDDLDGCRFGSCSVHKKKNIFYCDAVYFFF
jgi:hypothetical protein